jgi:hypothetical protein
MTAAKKVATDFEEIIQAGKFTILLRDNWPLLYVTDALVYRSPTSKERGSCARNIRKR